MDPKSDVVSRLAALRETFCTASPGSDVEFESFLEGFDAAVAIVAADLAQGGAARDVLAERARQSSDEGWTAEHDDQHTDQSLALVAAIYAAPFRLFCMEGTEDCFVFEDPWPSEWDKGWDKRDQIDRRRQLVIAGALILAEIERLDRTTLTARGLR